MQAVAKALRCGVSEVAGIKIFFRLAEKRSLPGGKFYSRGGAGTR